MKRPPFSYRDMFPGTSPEVQKLIDESVARVTKQRDELLAEAAAEWGVPEWMLIVDIESVHDEVVLTVRFREPEEIQA